MGQALQQESPRYRDMDYDGEKVRRILQVMGSDEASAAFVAESDGELQGATVIAVAGRWFGSGFFVTDLSLYVKPEHRGGAAFGLLIDAIEHWTAARGIRDITLGVSTEVHPEATVRAYERKGYKVTGYTLAKVLDHVS